MKKCFWGVLCVFLVFGCASEKHGLDPANMDRTADPAQDFYQFVNGGWMEKTEIPESESRWGVFSELRDLNKQQIRDLLQEVARGKHEAGTNAQKVGDFYRTGMDSAKIEENGLTPIQSYLDDIAAVRTYEDVLNTVVGHQKLGSGALFAVFAEGDLKNSEINTVYAFQAGLGMPDRDYYLDDGDRFKNYRTEYEEHLRKMFELIGDDSTTAQAAAQKVMNIETRMAKASWTRVQLRNIEGWYNKRTWDEGLKETPNIDWQKHFEKLGVSDVDYFVLAQPDFFKEVDAMLTALSIDDWKTYLRWHLVNALAPYLSSDFVTQDFHFFRTVLRGVKEQKPRWKRITETANANLGEALGQLYTEKYFPPEAKEQANILVENLRVAFHTRLEKLDWMSPETKENAYKKLANLVPMIGYPDKWKDYSALEIKHDIYVLNVIRANEFEFDYDMNKVGKPVDKTEWGMTPQTVNAGFHPIKNTLTFPGGILQPPFFDPKVDDALNYGAIGAAIGHEITHGYDDQGSKFDADGNLKNWWTEEDRKLFEEKTNVIVEQFDSYTVLDSVQVTGKLTLGENIGDQGGLAIAFDAFKIALEKKGSTGLIDGFTPEQRFFLSYGTIWRNKYRDDALLNLVKTNPHSPPQYRVLGTLSTMPAFYEAFSVQPGDAMRRPDSLTAKIW